MPAGTQAFTVTSAKVWEAKLHAQDLEEAQGESSGATGLSPSEAPKEGSCLAAPNPSLPASHLGPRKRAGTVMNPVLSLAH